MPFDRLPSNDIRVPQPNLVPIPPRPVIPWTQIVAPINKAILEAAEYASPLGKLKRDLLLAQLQTKQAQLEWEKRLYSGAGGGYGSLQPGMKWARGPNGMWMQLPMTTGERALESTRTITAEQKAADYNVNQGKGGGYNIDTSNLPPPPQQQGTPAITPNSRGMNLTPPTLEGGVRAFGGPSALYDINNDPGIHAHLSHEPDTSPVDYYDMGKLFFAGPEADGENVLPEEPVTPQEAPEVMAT